MPRRSTSWHLRFMQTASSSRRHSRSAMQTKSSYTSRHAGRLPGGEPPLDGALERGVQRLLREALDRLAVDDREGNPGPGGQTLTPKLGRFVGFDIVGAEVDAALLQV